MPGRTYKKTASRVKRISRNVYKRSSTSPGALAVVPHTFVRSFFQQEALTSLSTVNYIAAANGNYFNQMPNASEFAVLFDQYKIMKVEWTYTPRFDSVALDASATPWTLPRFYSVIDKDDSSTPTSLNQLMQYGNMKSQVFNKPVKITYVPNVAAQVYGNLVSTGYAAKANQYIDMSNLDVNHFGHKVWINLNNTAMGANFKVDTMCRITFQCKNLR